MFRSTIFLVALIGAISCHLIGHVDEEVKINHRIAKRQTTTTTTHYGSGTPGDGNHPKTFSIF